MTSKWKNSDKGRKYQSRYCKQYRINKKKERQKKINDNLEVEIMYKAEIPLNNLTSEGYFGYRGVLLRDKTTDLVQCHICGHWVTAVLSHSRIAHKICGYEYRRKFSLPLSYPLCSRRYSLKRREMMLARIENNKNEFNRFVSKKASNRSRVRALLYGRNSMAFLNRLGNCPEQVLNRYLIVCDLVGGEATPKQVKDNDSRLYGIINNRYGGFPEFRKNNGLTERLVKKPSTKIKLINELRKWVIRYERIPMRRDFELANDEHYSYDTYIDKFGSWRRALATAGII